MRLEKIGGSFKVYMDYMASWIINNIQDLLDVNDKNSCKPDYTAAVAQLNSLSEGEKGGIVYMKNDSLTCFSKTKRKRESDSNSDTSGASEVQDKDREKVTAKDNVELESEPVLSVSGSLKSVSSTPFKSVPGLITSTPLLKSKRQKRLTGKDVQKYKQLKLDSFFGNCSGVSEEVADAEVEAMRNKKNLGNSSKRVKINKKKMDKNDKTDEEGAKMEVEHVKGSKNVKNVKEDKNHAVKNVKEDKNHAVHATCRIKRC